jgi:hypothetical protein
MCMSININSSLECYTWRKELPCGRRAVQQNLSLDLDLFDWT